MMTPTIFKIPHLSEFKYKFVKNPKRFRIVKYRNVFRVDFQDWPLGWDTKLKGNKYFAGIEDGYSTEYSPLYFQDPELAKQYIKKATRKRIKFKKTKLRIYQEQETMKHQELVHIQLMDKLFINTIRLLILVCLAILLYSIFQLLKN